MRIAIKLSSQQRRLLFSSKIQLVFFQINRITVNRRSIRSIKSYMYTYVEVGSILDKRNILFSVCTVEIGLQVTKNYLIFFCAYYMVIPRLFLFSLFSSVHTCGTFCQLFYLVITYRVLVFKLIKSDNRGENP